MSNRIKRFIFGVLSSTLFAIGLVRAADALDPMSRSLPPADAIVKDATPSSVTECDAI